MVMFSAHGFLTMLSLKLQMNLVSLSIMLIHTSSVGTSDNCDPKVCYLTVLFRSPTTSSGQVGKS